MAIIVGKAQSIRHTPPILPLLLLLLLVTLCLAGAEGRGTLLGDSEEEEGNHYEKFSIINFGAHDQQQQQKQPLPTSSSDAAQWCPKVVFNFGDSLSDTGNALAAIKGLDAAGHPPYGSSFFGRPNGRWCDGRLVIDYLLLSFKLPLLHPYVVPTGGKDVRGLNFAYAGATASDDNALHKYNLKLQIHDFLKAKSSAMKADYFTGSYLNDLKKIDFGSALYTVCIGGNDVLSALAKPLPKGEIFERVVPGVIQAIIDAVKTLYLQEARKFLIYNIPPEGCSPSFLSLLDGWRLPKDSLGCLDAVDEINQAINSGLAAAVRHLRGVLPGVSITLFDYYAANVEILTNLPKYGFDPQLGFVTCCGSPGVEILNYNPRYPCGSKKATTCSNVDDYINWDGTHFTEAFYREIAMFTLNGEFSDPPTNLTEVCNLSFEDFYGESYDDIFPERDSPGGLWVS